MRCDAQTMTASGGLCQLSIQCSPIVYNLLVVPHPVY